MRGNDLIADLYFYLLKIILMRQHSVKGNKSFGLSIVSKVALFKQECSFLGILTRNL